MGLAGLTRQFYTEWVNCDSFNTNGSCAEVVGIMIMIMCYQYNLNHILCIDYLVLLKILLLSLTTTNFEKISFFS